MQRVPLVVVAFKFDPGLTFLQTDYEHITTLQEQDHPQIGTGKVEPQH